MVNKTLDADTSEKNFNKIIFIQFLNSMFMNLETHNKRYQRRVRAFSREYFGIKFVKIRQTVKAG